MKKHIVIILLCAVCTSQENSTMSGTWQKSTYKLAQQKYQQRNFFKMLNSETTKNCSHMQRAWLKTILFVGAGINAYASHHLGEHDIHTQSYAGLVFTPWIGIMSGFATMTLGASPVYAFSNLVLQSASYAKGRSDANRGQTIYHNGEDW